MSVALTMVDVLRTVPTPRALSRVAAEVDSNWLVMEETAMVRHCYYNSLFTVLGFKLNFSPQTSMSVALTMVAVLTTVPTLRALSRAAAEVDSN